MQILHKLIVIKLKNSQKILLKIQLTNQFKDQVYDLSEMLSFDQTFSAAYYKKEN